MKLRRLGTSDLQVSELCLGTMQFGWTTSEHSAFEVMDAFVAAGGNFFDTSDLYSRWAGHPGISEEIIGRWLKDRGARDSVVVATKVRGEMWGGPGGEGLSRAHIARAAEDSLRRLQVDTIDLYQCHWPDDDVPIAETLAAFAELIEAGKVRYVGVSNYTPEQLADALIAAGEELPRFVSLQPHYNLVHREEFEESLAELCRQENIGVIPYSPLAGGFLTGKYQANAPLPESQRSRGARKYMNEQGFAVVAALDRLASAHDTTVPAVALAWMRAQPAITAPIIGANTPEQLAELLPAVDLDLSSEELATLDAASAST